jgi:hypothetical protein
MAEDLLTGLFLSSTNPTSGLGRASSYSDGQQRHLISPEETRLSEDLARKSIEFEHVKKEYQDLYKQRKDLAYQSWILAKQLNNLYVQRLKTNDSKLIIQLDKEIQKAETKANTADNLAQNKQEEEKLERLGNEMKDFDTDIKKITVLIDKEWKKKYHNSQGGKKTKSTYIRTPQKVKCKDGKTRTIYTHPKTGKPYVRKQVIRNGVKTITYVKY